MDIFIHDLKGKKAYVEQLNNCNCRTPHAYEARTYTEWDNKIKSDTKGRNNNTKL